MSGSLGQVRGVGGAKVVTVRRTVQAAIDRFEQSTAVNYAEPNYIYRTQAIPNDPQFGQLYGLNNAGQTGGTPDADIDAPEGWDAFGLSSFPLSGGAEVGIVDTGIQQNHPDLAVPYLPERGKQRVAEIAAGDPNAPAELSGR